MTKKEYIIEILENLKDEWDLARGLIVVVKSVQDNSKEIDLIFQILKNALKSFEGEKYKLKVIRTINNIKQNKQKEQKMIEKDLLDLENQLKEI